MRFLVSLFSTFSVALPALGAPGDWPEPRQNAHLTGYQPMPGAMHNPPQVLATFDLGRSHPSIIPVTHPATGEALGLALVAGALHCYDTTGALRWRAHPPGLNFDAIQAVRDLDGDGDAEVLLQAGRSAMPFGAAVLLSLDTGALEWRYDVDPMSDAWYLHAGSYLPGSTHEQIIAMMHGYPPDPENGYITLFDFDTPGEAPRQRWRYDFDQYTCFPSLLQTDLEGDGKQELVVETHSRMWFLDTETGAVKHFTEWDVSPANIRSYGLVKFLDLNGDAREDFLCIANFAQHHEVLLNQEGKMVKAWHQGWPESVTTGKVVSTWPEPPHADVDGDGDLEILVSMFNSEGKPEWLLRVYDAVTGDLQYRFPGIIAKATGDLDGDGSAEILADRCSEPTQSELNGALLLKAQEGQIRAVWEKPEANARLPRPDGTLIVRQGNERLAVRIKETGDIVLEPWASPQTAPAPDFSSVPAVVGPAMPQLLAADVLPEKGNELVMFRDNMVTLLALEENVLVERRTYTSSCPPAIADFDGDGVNDLALATVSATAAPQVKVLCPAQEDRELWQATLPPPGRAGLPQPRAAYLRTGRFTGAATPDLYLWAGTPLVRSLVLNGRTGDPVWERGEIPGNERYWGPSVNLASVWDFNADGKEDLIFTNPDYYCVADGATGGLLLGPLFPPDIFNQPSQGLYTLPALLTRGEEAPWVALTSGHYFQAAMTLEAAPLWHRLPMPGEARTGAEAFLQDESGAWLMGVGRQNGNFACINVVDGSVRWEFPLQATASDVMACDVDGDGRVEFVMGTSHGDILSLGDKQGAGELLWKVRLDSAAGNVIAADLTADGKTELVVPTAHGKIIVLTGTSPEAAATSARTEVPPSP